MRNMLLVSECVAKAALQRTESRGGHTRDDHPAMDANWRNTLLVCRAGEAATASDRPRRHRRPPSSRLPMRPDLLELFELVRAGEVLHRRRTGRAPGTEGLRWLLTTRAAGLARRRRRRRAAGLHRRGQRGRGGARHHPPAAGHPGPRSGGAMELQGGQVRVVLGGDQRPAAAAVHDADVDVRRGRDRHRHADAGVPGDARPGHRRVLQLRRRRARSRRSRRRRTCSRASTGCSRWTSSGRQEFRKCIECFLCQNTCHVVRDHEENKEAFSGPRYLMRIAELDMHPLDTAGPQGHGAGGLRPRATATSPSAAPRCAPSTSRSPTTR